MTSGEARLIGPEAVVDALVGAAVDRGRPDIAGEFAVTSSVVVPIESRGQVLGVLVLSSEGERTLGVDDLDLAVEVGHRAALALGNARAYQQEHQIAESLQRSLLPATVGNVDGLDVAVRYLAATDGASVGGDWYDVISFDDGTVGVVVGDVVGHDLAASSAMGQLRSTLRAFAYEDHASPAGSLARLDRLFEALGLSYATCVLGIIDAATGAFRWSAAGHPPPLLVRGDTARLLDGGGGPLLGVAEGTAAGEAATELDDGDFLVLYTDGLVERRRESISEGLDRLVRVAAGAGATSAEALCSALVAGLLPPGTAREDDVAILVARLQRVVGGDVHRLDLAPDAHAVREARQFVGRLLDDAGWHDQRDVAQLLVSELATNAVRYGGPPISLTVTIDGNLLEVAVTDEEPGGPPAASTVVDELAESGRGLHLVEVLSATWGTRTRPSGKSVWFTLER
jgi:serine phosphatase RsbU (regulator of sigma subunit)/anti-sigma regulatory factor (Ser/Thr protein kinase)